MEIDLKTEKEKQREKRNGQICSEYISIKQKVGEVAPNRVMVMLGKKYNLTRNMIRNILLQYKVI